MPNLHFLELFYYVARHGGLSQAVRKIPYGIQQPAISRQLMQLEEQIGAILFERRPFRLTAAGEKLYAFIKPFFEGLKEVVAEVKAGVPDTLRIAASPMVLRDYLPAILRSLRPSFPKLRITLKEGLQTQIHEWFDEHQIDLAVTMLEGAPPPECLSETLLRLPMMLLVEPHSPLRSAAELWRRQPIKETLVSPKAEDAASRCFHQGLQERGIQWEIGMEMNSIELVEAFVRDGCGIGISVAVPGRQKPAGLRVLPLPGFPKIPIGMLWRRHPNRVVSALMEALRKEAQRMQQMQQRSR